MAADTSCDSWPVAEEPEDARNPDHAAVRRLLDEVAQDQREGWVFNPVMRGNHQGRYTTHRVGQIITEIGKAAGIVVNEFGKFASAHDAAHSGSNLPMPVSPRDLQAIMRHSSFKTTEKYYLRHRAADQAERLAKYLGKPQREVASEPAAVQA